MQELDINNNSIIQKIIDINISDLINIVNKKQKLIKKIVTSKTTFSFLMLLAISINNFEINKTLSNLIKAFENLKINNARNIIENKIYQIIQRVLISQSLDTLRFIVSQIQIIIQTQSQNTIIVTQKSIFVFEYNKSQLELNKYLFCYNEHRQQQYLDFVALQINKKIYLNNNNRIYYRFNNFENKEIKLFLNNIKIKSKIVKLCLQ